MKLKILDPDEFVPIDYRKVRDEWDKVMNVPTNAWRQISIDIDVINDRSAPYTLRTFKLNQLPFMVIQILLGGMK
jgi:hypothetical protein